MSGIHTDSPKSPAGILRPTVINLHCSVLFLKLFLPHIQTLTYNLIQHIPSLLKLYKISPGFGMTIALINTTMWY